MSDDDKTVCKPIDHVDENDEVLERIEDEERAGVGGDSDRPEVYADAAEGPQTPFELEVTKPRAIDIRRVADVLGRQVPPSLQANLGAKVPILLAHGLTPFYPAGERPVGVWGLGYRAELLSVRGADTVALTPGTQLGSSLEARVDVDAGIRFSGEVEVLEHLRALGAMVPGVALNDAAIHASAEASFAMNLRYKFAGLEVQAGPVGAGGVRWNLYRKRQRIDVHHPLFHTVMLPNAEATLTIRVEVWIKRSRRWYEIGETRVWRYEPMDYTISLSGLDPAPD